MKKVCAIFLSLTIFLMGISVVNAATIYLPTEDSSEYLPTVKIFSYTFSYDGTLVAEGYGSGTLIDSVGTILTNNHVIENMYDPADTYDAFQICLTKSNNPEEPLCQFTASEITRDKDKDLALLRMDGKDVKGTTVDFDFYLPYDNDSNYQIGETVTIIGYPDTGGKTITYTSGLISGLIEENGIDYIKTDADISFGNSGGTAVDEDGNFIGVPTYIVGSYSAEVLGYFFPVKDAVTWINANKSGDLVENTVAKDKLKSEVLSYLTANEDGTYKNDYPPYEISLIDDWKFGNSLEGAFENQDFYSYSGYNALTIYPVDRTASSFLSVTVSSESFPYEITLDDVRDIYGSYYSSGAYAEDEATYAELPSENALEEVMFNGKYPALKGVTSQYDWWTYEYYTAVSYYIPYGDYLITVSYTYTDAESARVSEAEEIIGTFAVDLADIKLSIVDVVESTEPNIKVTNPLEDGYLSDVSYEYDGINYFGASFGKKNDYNFAVSIYYNTYWDETYVGNFATFQEDTLSDMEEWYDIIAKGELEVDGHKGFFFIEEYDGYDSTYYYATMYLEYDDNSYVSVNYSGNEESYTKNLFDLKQIIRKLELTNDGEGRYLVPAFSITGGGSGGIGVKLSDIKDYVYEDSIRALDSRDVFGDESPVQFNPAGSLTRKDFVVWAVKAATGDTVTEFADFSAGVIPHSFEDVTKDSEEEKYIEFAKQQGAINGTEKYGKVYFKPDEQISLVAALKITFTLYGYDVWEAPSFLPWYIPYIQLGYKEGVIPYGVSDVNYLLTRGEGAFIIDALTAYYDYYYDEYYY